jgi:hypothetical protein
MCGAQKGALPVVSEPVVARRDRVFVFAEDILHPAVVLDKGSNVGINYRCGFEDAFAKVLQWGPISARGYSLTCQSDPQPKRGCSNDLVAARLRRTTPLQCSNSGLDGVLLVTAQADLRVGPPISAACPFDYLIVDRIAHSDRENVDRPQNTDDAAKFHV